MTRRFPAAFLAASGLLLAPSIGQAERSGISVSAKARGVSETDTPDGGNGTSRMYNTAEPSIELLLPWQALRLDVAYQPIFYFPIQGQLDSRVRTFHIGRAKLTAVPTRELNLSATDEMRATPLTFTVPSESPENLVQTNDARAEVFLDHWMNPRVSLESRAGAHRFDTFKGLITEVDSNGNAIADPAEDLNGNHVFDAGLRPSYSELLGSQAALWHPGTSTSLGLKAGVSAVAYDQLVSRNYVSGNGGLELRRRIHETLEADAHLLGTLYDYTYGRQATGYEGGVRASWQATREMNVGVAETSRRSMDAFANLTDVHQLVLTGHRDFARSASLDLTGQGARARTAAASTTPGYSDVTSAAASAELRVPIRWGFGSLVGYRIWRGGGPQVGWRTNQLFYVGVSWE